MLRLAEIEKGDIRLTDVGREFAGAALDDRKKLFQHQLLAYVPLAAYIRRVLRIAPITSRREAGFSTSLKTT
jgi:NitT/TauT family transport system ATP-binding protein